MQYRKTWRAVNTAEMIKKTNRRQRKSIDRAEILILLMLQDNGPMLFRQIRTATNCRRQYLMSSCRELLNQNLVTATDNNFGDRETYTITPAGVAYLDRLEHVIKYWRKPERITRYKRS